MTDATFSSWRQSATNKLEEHEHFPMFLDVNLANNFTWWDCSKFSETMYYGSDRTVGANNFDGFLDVFVVETNGMHIMYIHGKMGGR